MIRVGLETRLRVGVQVFAVLTLLTAVEWFVATAHVPGALWWLVLLALAKTALIGEYFMHFSQLLRPEE
jgi:cytochrome c oxidase subunit IV